MLALFQRYPEVNQRFNLRLHEYIETSVSTQGYALTTGLLKGFSAMSTRPDEAVHAGMHTLIRHIGVCVGTVRPRRPFKIVPINIQVGGSPRPTGSIPI